MAKYKILKTSDVKVGDKLPELSVPVSASTIVLGAMASRDWRPMHHDKDFAQNQGVSNIFLNTPAQAMWFERYVTDWAGPYARLGSMQFQMKKSVIPGDTMVFHGTVGKVETDAAGCGWAELTVDLSAAGEIVTSCTIRVALPTQEGDNPWTRKGGQWIPQVQA